MYLHDTPGRHIFAEPERAYSHGCMRVERPLELAEHLLRELGWEREEIRAAMERGVERTVTLDEPVPVHFLYWTAWVEPDGRTVTYTDDPYGIDPVHRRLLN